MLQKYEPTRFREKDVVAPLRAEVTTKDLVWQFWKDIFGKEVQSAATYSYLWMADQMGHIAIGLMSGLLLQAVFRECTAQDMRVAAFLFGAAVTTAIVGIWEWRAYRASVRDAAAAGSFKLNVELLGRNALAATAYMAFGGIAGASIALGLWYSLLVFAGMAALAIRYSTYWIRQKIVWQCAGLPYLTRMANIKLLIDDPVAIAETVEKLDRLLAGGELLASGRLPASCAPPDGEPRQVIISGPVGVGKTELATAIATEFAFNGHRCRYLTFGKLVETMIPAPAAPTTDDLGPANILYWPWRTAQVLVVDDIDPGARQDFMEPADFARIMASLDPAQRGFIGTRHTIWVLGAQTEADYANWVREIRTLAPAEAQPIEVRLTLPKTDPTRSSRAAPR